MLGSYDKCLLCLPLRQLAIESETFQTWVRRCVMVSYDHFRIALLTRLRHAEAEGQTEITVNSVEFCASFRRGALNVDACCQAMKDEMQVGDILEHDRDSGIGQIIRYKLPR